MNMTATTTPVYANAEGTEYIAFDEVKAAFMAGRTIIVINGNDMERVEAVWSADNTLLTYSGTYSCATE